MKKILIFVLVLALSIGMASIAFAGNNSATTDSATNFSTGKWAGQQKNCPQLKLSDEQKAQMASIIKQKLELQKQIIRDNVTNGTITAEQAKIMEGRIDTQLKAIESGKITLGMGGHELREGMPDTSDMPNKGIRGNANRNGQCPLIQQPAAN